tara:strand:+ start:9305 stop:10336 length:1032 start_codon:yes stop_codon:yes gene_type:complete
MKNIYTIIASLALVSTSFAGNPVRSGSAGASELLINPWARTASWAEGNTANVMGLESLYGNIAGLAFTKGLQAGFANSQWLVGSGIKMNAAAFATPTGNDGVLGIHITSMNYGDIDVTTTELPEGGAGTYRPTSSIIGLGYAKKFTQSIFGGVNIKLYSSSISNLTATGVCFDAGVQYVTGKDRDFKFGITLRNIGPSFDYGGDGMAIVLPVPSGSHTSTFDSRSQNFELPTQLAIGASKRIDLNSKNRLNIAGNFISNSFKKDQLTGALEFDHNDVFQVRFGYALFDNRYDGMATEAFSGPAAGFSVNSPTGNGGQLQINYSYRLTNSAFAGAHTLGVILIL